MRIILADSGRINKLSKERLVSTARWQIAFLAGIAYLIVATWIVFGSEVVTGFVALLALIGTIIHALTSRSDSKDDQKKWLVNVAKRAVQVSKLLKWMTVI